MNRTAFQIYGSKKTGIFQSTWDTTLVSALGSETAAVTATGTNWALDTGATNLNVGGYKHTTGSTTNLTTTLAAAIMQMYQITYTISGRTAGSITINYGGVSTSGITSSSSVNILATATTVFSITPTSDFDGVISISVKQTSSATNQIKLPLPNTGTYNIWVDWGDGTYNNITSYNSVNTLHTYPAPGIYTVRITGDRFNFGFGLQTNDRLKIKTIYSWGKLKFDSRPFYLCSNLTLSQVTDIPDLTGVTSFQYAFSGCSKITIINRLTEWDTSLFTRMDNAFSNCVLFNQSLNTFNVSNVSDMNDMFNGCVSFNNGYNPGIANQLPWNTSLCTSMIATFSGCSSFNSNLGTGTTPWDVSKVTTFTAMFNGTSNFNNGDDSAPINNWSINTTATSVAMNQMFQSSKFNRYIGDWNVSKVTAMGNMFLLNTSFNQDLSKWNVGSVTSMDAMFFSANAFTNGSNTNTNPITGLTGINGWNINTTVASVTMSNMFAQNTVFNQPIHSWDVSKVTNMNSMFYNASNFNKNIGSWNVSQVNNFTNFMFGKTPATFSSTNLDAIYNGWIVNGVKPNINISFGTAKYSQAGKAGKDTLLGSPNNWTITDGLLTVSATSNNGGLIRVTTSAAHGFTTGNIVYIYGVNGTTNANGTWTVTVVSTTVIELQGSTYNAAWTSGGNVILG